MAGICFHVAWLIIATQIVNKDTNSRFHSFGKGDEHVVSLVASWSSAPYLVAHPVRILLGRGELFKRPHDMKLQCEGTTHKTEPIVIP